MKRIAFILMAITCSLICSLPDYPGAGPPIIDQVIMFETPVQAPAVMVQSSFAEVTDVYCIGKIDESFITSLAPEVAEYPVYLDNYLPVQCTSYLQNYSGPTRQNTNPESHFLSSTCFG